MEVQQMRRTIKQFATWLAMIIAGSLAAIAMREPDGHLVFTNRDDSQACRVVS
jgi:hypothetical protein